MKSRLDGALRALTAIVPAVVGAAGAASTALAAHDDGIVRTVGAGFTGGLRALDLVVAAPALLVPIGTRALRAGLASALVTGLAGAVAFDLAREIVGAVVPHALELGRAFRSRRAPAKGPQEPPSEKAISPRFVAAVSAVAVLTALLSPSWQAEASATGGAVTGALLVLVALRLVASKSLPAIALALGLAASYEPLVLAGALAAFAPRVVESLLQRRSRAKAESASPSFDRLLALRVAVSFALGLLPLALGAALAARAPELALAIPLFSSPDGLLRPTSPFAFATTELGPLLLFVSASGVVLSLLAKETWQKSIPLVLVCAIGAIALVHGVPAGPSRYAAPVLAALACVMILGATTLTALVLLITRARVPFAEASAALVVVLELVLPVRAIDETTARREGHAPGAAAIWNDVAWGDAPPAAVLLVADRATMRRVASARATGHMRGDLLVVPAYDVQGRHGQRALLAEPKLAPLYRDMVLGVPPEELSLSQLGAQRAVLASFDPKWDRALSRHLVPIGLTARFEPEPRGSSERKRALEAFLPSRARLVRITVARKDAELAAATATLLRPRAVGMAATGDRDLLSQALDDLRAFAPEDPIGATLVRRIVTSKGSIDVRDLSL